MADIRNRMPTNEGRRAFEQAMNDAASKHKKEEEEDLSTLNICIFFVASIISIFFMTGIFLGIIFYLIPPQFDPQAVILPSPPLLIGPLAIDNRVNSRSEQWYQNQVQGPECIVPCAGHLYTGLLDGRIVLLQKNNRTRTVARIGPSKGCGRIAFIHGSKGAPECGRPLGLICHANKGLYVADSLRGLLYVENISPPPLQLEDEDLDIEAADPEQPYAKVSTLLPVGTEVEGVRVSLLNSLALLPGEDALVVTDSLTRYNMHDLALGVYENSPDGRVLLFNLTTNSATVLVKNLHFPNGVSLTHDRKAILIAESNLARILIYYLDGPRKGQLQPLLENLPGFPDDITLSLDGKTYWVGIHFGRDGDRWLNIFDLVSNRPWIRKLLVGMFPQRQLLALVDSYSILIRFDSRGRIHDSLHDPSGQVLVGPSSALEHEGELWVASYRANKIVNIPLPSASSFNSRDRAHSDEDL